MKWVRGLKHGFYKELLKFSLNPQVVLIYLLPHVDLEKSCCLFMLLFAFPKTLFFPGALLCATIRPHQINLIYVVTEL